MAEDFKMSERQSTPEGTTRKGVLATSTSILKSCGNLGILLLFLLAFAANAHATATVTTTTLKAGLTTAPATAITTAAYGVSVTMTATVSPSSAAGTVTFKVGGVALGSPVNVSSGSASLATTALALGANSLTAVFTPTNAAAFAASTSSATNVTVSQATTTTTLAVGLTTAPGTAITTAAYGASVTMTATVSPSTAAGTMTFKIGGVAQGSPVAVSNGSAALATTALAMGANSLTAVFTPTTSADDTSSTSAAKTVTVSQATTTTTLTAALTSALGTPVTTAPSGVSVTLIATVSPAAAAGTVVFKNNGVAMGSAVTVSSGTATLATSALPLGANPLTAVFTPTTAANDTSSTSSSLSFTITKPTTTTALTVSSGPYYYGANVTMNASVTPSASTGTVNFMDGATIVGSCTLSSGTCGTPVVITTLPMGANSLKAVYVGDSTYATSQSGTSTATVVATTTQVALVASGPATKSAGDSFTLTATVTAAVGSATVSGGNVTFYDSATLLGKSAVSAGTATLPAPTTLTPGKHYLIASYGGLYSASVAEFGSSISTSAQVTITNAQTITFTAPTSPVTYGALPVSLSASSTSSLAVTFTASGACSVNGTTLTYTGAGACTVTASQPGNNSFVAATPVQKTVTVNPAPLTITASSPSAIAYGAAIPTITGTYAGFVNAETKYTGLTARAICTTTYTTSSDPGSYPTSCSGAVGANYSITYPAGSFTVNKAAQTFSHWYNSSTVYGTPVTLSGVASSGLTIAYTVVSGPGSISSGTTLTPSGVGTIVVAANQAGNTDYTAATQATVNVKVYQAPLVVTASSPSVTYGDAVPTITASYVGFVNSDTSSNLTSQPRCGTAYTPASHVAATAPVTYCSAAVDANYSITYTTGSVTIGAATPTVTWPTTSGSHAYGTTLAGFALSGGSAVQPGTANSVTGTFAFTTPATTPGVSTTSASVTFSPTGANHTDYTSVTTTVPNYVSFTVTKATPVIASSLPTASSIPYSVALSPTSKLSGGAAHNPIATGTVVAGSFSWTTGSTVPSNVGTNSESVTFSPTDTANYNTATANVNVTVSKATPTVSVWPTASPINYGQALSASGSGAWLSDGAASVAGTFTWTNPSTVPGVGSNVTESVTFTPTTTTYYTNATGTVKITVNPLTAAINTLPTASAITYGQTLSSSTLTGGSGKVSGGGALAGRFTWTTGSTVPDVGGAAQGVTFTPTNTNYAPVTTGTVSVTVNKATPTVSVWPVASSIAYGQSLSSSSLTGATSSVAGSFGWTSSSDEPVAGTTSNSVTFTPSMVNGHADYSNVVGWVSVVVNPCGMQDSNANATAMYVYNDSETPTPALPDSSPIAIDAEGTNVSAVCAVNAGPDDTTVTPTIVTYPFITSGAASSHPADSNSYGTNAAVLAYGTVATPGTGATITIADDGAGDPGSISTANDYSNGVFASMGGTVIINDAVIGTSGNSSHALDATYGGTLTVTNVQAYTAGNNSAVIVTADGGGNVGIDGGYYGSSGSHSTGIRAAGTGSMVTVNDTQASTTISAQNAPAVVVDGANSVSITSTGGGISLQGALGDDHGIFLYFNPSKADATAGTATFTMTNGSLTYTCDATSLSVAPCPAGSAASDQNSPATLFAVANTAATITLTDVAVTNTTPTDDNANGTLLTAAALNSGTPGSNGGNVTFNANGEALLGDIVVDSISTVNLNLDADSADPAVPSMLTGTINGANTLGATVNMTIDATSTWVVTGNSYLTSLTNAVAGNSNITCFSPGECSVTVGGQLLAGVN